MQHGSVLWILSLLGAAVLAAPGEDGAEPVTDPNVAKKAVKRIKKEHKAAKSSRRRRELVRGLGLLHCEESAKLLLRIVNDDRDVRVRIAAMRSLAVVGRLKHLKRMFSIVSKNRDTALLRCLGPALSLVTDPEAPAWIVKKLLPSSKSAEINRSVTTYPVRMSAVEALGVMRVQGARGPLLRRLATDGIPTTGRSEVPEAILADLKYAIRFRKVTINTVALTFGTAQEDADEAYAFMKLISDQNGGHCIDLRVAPRIGR